MRIVKMNEVDSSIVEDIIRGGVIVYPTDTIYGIGCNAMIDDAVKRIFLIKRRPESMALSVIAPSFEWIRDNCISDMETVRKYLPGAYTVILKKKKRRFLEMASAGRNTIGIRIVEHPIMRFFEAAGVPFVTTSVNVSGGEPVDEVGKIPKDIEKYVDVAIDGGIIRGKPSVIVDLSGEKERILKR